MLPHEIRKEVAARKDFKTAEAIGRLAERQMTATDATTWCALHGEGTPLQRLCDVFLASRTNPGGGGSVHIAHERIADALGIGIAEVPELVAGLAHHKSLPSLVSESVMPLRDESKVAIIAYTRASGAALNWRIHNAPIRYQARYCALIGNPAATMAGVVLAAGQAHNSGKTYRMTSTKLASVVGCSEEDIAGILPILEQQGWVVKQEAAVVAFTPSAELIARWTQFQRDCCEPLREGKTVTKSGARETKWEIEVWRPSRNLAPLALRQGIIGDPLDRLPVGGGWNLYHMSDLVSGKHYYGITQQSLRTRLRQHVERRDSSGLNGSEANLLMSKWMRDLADQGRMPVIELVTSTGRTAKRHAEAIEHGMVLSGCAEFGESSVLNIEHHPAYKTLSANIMQCAGHAL